MTRLYILSDNALDELKTDSNIMSNIDKCYKIDGESILTNDKLKELRDCSISDELCDQMVQSSSDFEAAIHLHSSLNISPQLASDEHLWAYLSHGPLLKYVQKRWNIENNNNKLNHILDHWFINTPARIMRHALASLWWSVEISKLDEDDSYRLTRVLFENYSLRVISLWQLLRSRNVIRGILEWFYKNGTDKMEVRGSFIAKYLNQLASIKQFSILDYNDILKLIDDVKDVIEKITTKEDYQNLSVSDIIFNKREI